MQYFNWEMLKHKKSIKSFALLNAPSGRSTLGPLIVNLGLPKAYDVTMRASLTLITILGAFLLSFQAYGQVQGEGRMNMSMVRHHFVMRNGIDPKYASKVNPLKRNAENIATGKNLYEKSCALCHGMTGVGDGEAGKDLKPPPANIARFITMHNVPDGYLYWTIAEGGMPLETAMPPFKDVMKNDEIWKTIIFLREL